MQRGGRSSPCCLQAVTVWIRALQPPLTRSDAPPKRAAGRSAVALTAFRRLSPSSPVSHLVCPQRSFLPKTLLFLARLKLCAPRSLRSTSYRRELRGACAVLPCVHWRARVQRVNGVQRGVGGGFGGRYQSDILINSLDQMTSSLIYLSHQEENNMFRPHSSRFLNNNLHYIKSKVLQKPRKLQILYHIWSQGKSLTAFNKISTIVTDYSGKVANICDGQDVYARTLGLNILKTMTEITYCAQVYIFYCYILHFNNKKYITEQNMLFEGAKFCFIYLSVKSNLNHTSAKSKLLKSRVCAAVGSLRTANRSVDTAENRKRQRQAGSGKTQRWLICLHLKAEKRCQ